MDSILVKPVSWSSVRSSKYLTHPSIQLFGYTSDDKSIYIKIPFVSTSIIQYSEPLGKEELDDIKSASKSEDIRRSLVSEDVAIMIGASDFSDETLFEEEGIYVDPYGELTSFFEQKKMTCYNWVKVSQLKYIPKLSTSTLNYQTNSKCIESVVHDKQTRHKVLFWDIETYTDADEFTNPERDPITLISVVLSDGVKPPKGYLLTRIKMDPLEKLSMDVDILYFESEKLLIEGFYDIWIKFDPDRSVTYNGFSYDIPYLISRTNKLDIKVGRLGKIRTLNAWVKSQMIMTGGGPERKKRFITPGVEEIDLLMYFKLRYPSFPNHKLDTVGEKLLNMGKTGLSIDEMFAIFKKGDPKEMTKAGYYSIIDSILLYNLYYGYGDTNYMINESVEFDLEWICNKTAVTAENLLLMSPKETVKMLGYSVDPGVITRETGTLLSNERHLKNNGDFTIKPKFGIYTNVYVYDYSEVLYDIMSQSFDNVTKESSDLLKGSGIVLARALWDSSYTQTNSQHIESYIDQLNVEGIIVDLNRNSLVTISPIENEMLKLQGIYTIYAILSPIARYMVDSKNNIVTCHGRSEICRPNATIEEDIIAGWIEHIMDKNPNYKIYPLTVYTPIEKLVRKIKVDSVDEYSSNGIKKLLYQQIKPISTFKFVKYVYTPSGVEVYKNQNTKDLDLSRYNEGIFALYDKLMQIQGNNLSKVYY